MGATMTIARIVRMADPEDEEEVRALLEASHALRVARLGELLNPLDHRVLLATDDSGTLLGLLTLRLDEGAAEVVTLHVRNAWQGTGTLLLDAAARWAREHRCKRLFLITTNDNTDALRFYQRRGFRLIAMHPGAVDDSRRRLKSEIPEVGNHGIRIRDELVLERELELP
jgi:GNAT superfamily N-acetyltransferase